MYFENNAFNQAEKNAFSKWKKNQQLFSSETHG